LLAATRSGALEAAGNSSVAGAGTVVVGFAAGVADAGTSRSSSSGATARGEFWALADADHKSRVRASGAESKMTMNKGRSEDERAKFRLGQRADDQPWGSSVSVVGCGDQGGMLARRLSVTRVADGSVGQIRKRAVGLE
jgi:hypothetical protein